MSYHVGTLNRIALTHSKNSRQGYCCRECAACSGPSPACLARSGGLAGLGDLWHDAGVFLGGLSLPVVIIAGFVLYLALAGPGAKARKDALREENERHSQRIAEIKRKYKRLPVGTVYAG